MLEKLTLNNMDAFKEIYNKNFEKITYNKDFFRCYEEQNFLFKFLYRKFVRLIKLNDKYIGYIWYEGISGSFIKVWALYVDASYRELINEYILSYFDNNTLYFEEIDSIENTLILTKLGFKKESYTILLKMNITCFDNILNKDIEPNISIRNLTLGKDEILRCNIQNDIFLQWNRRPLTVDDIYADMTQDYYLNDLCFFGMLNNDYIGYGQIIFNRNMYTIVNFGLINKYRGKGLSKTFLSKIIKAAKDYGIEELYIRVDSNNIKAINLYKSLGFKEANKILIWEREI